MGAALGSVKFPKSFRNFTASVKKKDRWNIFNFSQKWVLRAPQGRSNLKKVDFQDVVGSLNLCLEKPGTMQKDIAIATSEHPSLRKH